MWSEYMLRDRVEKPELPACDCVDSYLAEQLYAYHEANAGGALENRCHKHGELVIV